MNEISVFDRMFLIVTRFVLGSRLTNCGRKKQNAAKEIEYTNRLLNEVQKNEKTSVNRLRLLNSRLPQRNLLITSIKQEINVYQEFIDNNIYVVKSLKKDVEQLKKEYAELIRFAYRNKSLNDNILFLLSAENFNQAYRRFLYMKQYTYISEKTGGNN